MYTQTCSGIKAAGLGHHFIGQDRLGGSVVVGSDEGGEEEEEGEWNGQVLPSSEGYPFSPIDPLSSETAHLLSFSSLFLHSHTDVNSSPCTALAVSIALPIVPHTSTHNGTLAFVIWVSSPRAPLAPPLAPRILQALSDFQSLKKRPPDPIAAPSSISRARTSHANALSALKTRLTPARFFPSDRRPQQAQQQDGVVGPPPTSSNPKPEKHRRSKSAMVSNFLSAPSHVAKSAKNKLSSSNGGVGSDRSSSAHSRAGSFTTASPNSSLNHLSADEREGRGQQRQKANAATSTATGTTATTTATMSGSSAIGSDNPAAAATRSSMTSDRPPSANTTAKTVEETVRTFRLYEALRNGDTAGISRAIREGTQYADRQGSVASVATSSTSATADKAGILNLAVQCAELPVIEYILSTTSRDRASTSNPYLDVNHADPATGNTPLHVAAQLGRLDVVQLLLKQEGINDAIVNHRNQTPLDVARKSSVYGMLQLARNLYLEDVIEKVHGLVERHEYENLEALLESPRVKGLLDINTIDPPNAPGSTLLHEAARKKDLKLIQSLLLHGADPFRRDKRGKLPQDVTKDDTTRAVLKKSPAAMAAARGIEEKAVLAGAAEFAVHHGQGGQDAGAGGSVAGKESREMKGYLKKWTNYTSGYKLRWFVLEDGVLSYYKNQGECVRVGRRGRESV